ncbi:MAG: hypothetical protein ACK5Q6_14130 [Cyanobacteriota bacterium]
MPRQHRHGPGELMLHHAICVALDPPLQRRCNAAAKSLPPATVECY